MRALCLLGFGVFTQEGLHVYRERSYRTFRNGGLLPIPLLQIGIFLHIQLPGPAEMEAVGPWGFVFFGFCLLQSPEENAIEKGLGGQFSETD